LELVELVIELETQGVGVARGEAERSFALLPTVRRLLAGDEEDDSEGASMVREPRRPTPPGPLIDAHSARDDEGAGNDLG
jgi:hypothetical protein